MDREKKSWILIYPYVFIFIKNGSAILYNSDTGESIVSDSIHEINELSDLENMYSIPVDSDILDKNDLIKQIVDRSFGELIPFKRDMIKPISVYPHCVIEKNMNKDFEDADLTTYFFELTELTLMLTGYCSSNCVECNTAYRQYTWCHKQPGEIDLERIKRFLRFVPSSGVMRINLIGGDIFSYYEIDKLLLFLKRLDIKKRFITHYELILEHLGKLSLFTEHNFSLEILVDNFFKEEQLKKVINSLKPYRVNYIMAVSSADDYDIAVKFAENNNIEPEIVPLYNGINISFFEDNVFIEKEEILKDHLSMKEIFAHQLINTNTYGKLTIKPDGNIFSSVNRPSLGTVDDNIFKIIHSQLLEGSGWRNIRNNNICAGCLLQWLCPSPSNYEVVMNRKTICNIK